MRKYLLLWIAFIWSIPGLAQADDPTQLAYQQAQLQAFYDDPRNVGVDLDTLAQVRADIAAGVYDRACTAEEHDPHEWHLLVSPEHGCHYNHHHGDDPALLNDICAQRPDGSSVCFDEPGAWFDKPGQSISYPWQTFTADVDAPPDITAEQAGSAAGGMENQAKHEGYFWIVRTNQTCQADDEYCTTDFRLQVHGMMFAHGAAVRYHSMSYEARVCQDASDPTTCGIMRRGGWGDFGILMAPQYDGVYDCRGVDINSRYGDPEIEIPLAVDTQFSEFLPVGNPDRYENLPPAVDERFRCHNILTDAQLADHIAAGESAIVAQWWIRDPQRQQIRFYDPIGNVMPDEHGTGHLTIDYYCAMAPETRHAADPNCRMNQSRFTSAAEYITGFYEAIATNWEQGRHDINGDLLTDVTRETGIYTNRWGEDNTAVCTGPALDCIPYVVDNLYYNEPQWNVGLYNHYECVWDGAARCPVLDHDLTPVGQASWINWFYRYVEPAIPNPGTSAADDGCTAGIRPDCGLNS